MKKTRIADFGQLDPARPALAIGAETAGTGIGSGEGGGIPIGFELSAQHVERDVPRLQVFLDDAVEAGRRSLAD